MENNCFIVCTYISMPHTMIMLHNSILILSLYIDGVLTLSTNGLSQTNDFALTSTNMPVTSRGRHGE